MFRPAKPKPKQNKNPDEEIKREQEVQPLPQVVMPPAIRRYGTGIQVTTPPITDHSLLSNLLVDKHTMYALADKTRPTPWVAETDIPFIPVLYEKLRLNTLHMSPLCGEDLGAATGWANYLLASPFIFTRRMRIDAIAVFLQAIPPSFQINIGLYESDNNAYPTSLLAQVQNATSILGTYYGGAVDLTLDKGLYFIAVVTNNNDVGFTDKDCLMSPLGVFGSSRVQAGKWYKEYSFAPLPTTFPADAAVDSCIHTVAVRIVELL